VIVVRKKGSVNLFRLIKCAFLSFVYFFHPCGDFLVVDEVASDVVFERLLPLRQRLGKLDRMLRQMQQQMASLVALHVASFVALQVASLVS
jgi:hypothetical protein